MTFSLIGTASSQHIGPADPVSLTLTRNISVGDVLVVVAGGDSNSISLTSLTDTKGHTWDREYVTAGQGNLLIGWIELTSAMTSGTDKVTINYSSSNDVMAQLYAFSGVTTPDKVSTNKSYTFGTPTYSLSMSNSGGGVQFCVFTFPFDFFSASISGWTKFSDIQDGTDQCLLGYYKEVSSGSNTCSRTVGEDIAYFAAGMVLPLGTSTTSPPSTTPPPGTTTPAPAMSALGSSVISFF